MTDAAHPQVRGRLPRRREAPSAPTAPCTPPTPERRPTRSAIRRRARRSPSPRSRRARTCSTTRPARRGTASSKRRATRARMAIGVDADQYDEMPGTVVTSMIKRGDVAVFDIDPRRRTGNVRRRDARLRSRGRCPRLRPRGPARRAPSRSGHRPRRIAPPGDRVGGALGAVVGVSGGGRLLTPDCLRRCTSRARRRAPAPCSGAGPGTDPSAARWGGGRLCSDARRTWSDWCRPRARSGHPPPGALRDACEGLGAGPVSFAQSRAIAVVRFVPHGAEGAPVDRSMTASFRRRTRPSTSWPHPATDRRTPSTSCTASVIDATDAPVDVMAASVRATDAPVDVMTAPADATDAPVDATTASVDATDAPVDAMTASCPSDRRTCRRDGPPVDAWPRPSGRQTRPATNGARPRSTRAPEASRRAPGGGCPLLALGRHHSGHVRRASERSRPPPPRAADRSARVQPQSKERAPAPGRGRCNDEDSRARGAALRRRG